MLKICPLERTEEEQKESMKMIKIENWRKEEKGKYKEEEKGEEKREEKVKDQEEEK